MLSADLISHDPYIYVPPLIKGLDFTQRPIPVVNPEAAGYLVKFTLEEAILFSCNNEYNITVLSL